MRADHPPEHVMCESKRKADAVGLDATPAIGKQREQQQEPVLDAPHLTDGQAKRQQSRPSNRSLDENRRYGR